jgi:CDP-glycerol glycerophosphotransferase (TagB/SpsB family)
MAGRARRSLARRAAPPVAFVVTVSEAQARHLDECLSSVYAQAATRPDAVLAPWGTWREDPPAGSLAPVGTLAEARQAGLAATRAPYVRFVEATDTIPSDATGVLLEALLDSSAPSAAGVSERIDATWRDRAHQVAPEAALDLGARLFRLSDEVRAALVFEPAHGRWGYATLAALDHVAGPVAVPHVVHHDHHREHGLPFGHLPRRADDVHTLAAAVQAAVALVDPDVARRWAAGVLDRRVPTLVEDVESYDDDTWAALRRTTSTLAALADSGDLRVESRLKAWLVTEDRREELTALVLRRWRDSDDFPTRVVAGGSVIADLGVDAPDEVLTMHPRGTPLWASLRRSHAKDDTWTAELVVVAFGVPSSTDDQVTATLRCRDTGAEVTVRATPHVVAEADGIVAETWTDHTASGWALTVDAEGLTTGTHEIVIELRHAGVVRRGQVTHRDELGSAGHLEATAAGAAIRPHWSAGTLVVDVGPPEEMPSDEDRPRLVGLSVEEQTVTLRLTGAATGLVELAGPGGRVSGLVTPDGATALVRLVVDPWALGERPLPVGRYDVRLLAPDGAIELGLSDDLLAATPLEEQGPLHRVTVRATRRGTALIVLDDLRGPDEVGPGAQRRLQQEYAATTEPVDPGLAYFQSYTGQWPTDSPLAIHESLRRQRPDIRVRWCVDDPGVPVPEGAEPVLIRSREWYDTLARAKWVVTNIEMERWFRRRPEQELMQTWHGNPGKVMGLGLWRANGLTPGRIEHNLDHGPRNWTLLMSPSPEMTTHYRREFAYAGAVVDQGYARDDALLAPSAAKVREDTRRRLDIGAGKTAVLYAPTWRDALATNYRAARLQDDLDLTRLATALGPGHVVLLRGHRFHARHAERPRGARILDVTDYPEINHLVLAADVAVLDYSSLRFDIGVVGTPMVFLVPDLATYEQERGFLYDFRSSAPGPLLATTDEVVAALHDLDGLRRRYAAVYAEFRDRFHGGQDGHAADRAVSAFFSV